MGDVTYIVVMAAVSGCLLVYLFYSLKRRSRLERVLTMVICFAFLITGSYIPALFSRSPLVSAIFYAIYFGCNTWLCVSIFLFAHIYTGQKRNPRWLKTAAIIAVIADSISMAINPWTGHAVVFQFVQTADISCWKFSGTGWFDLHLLLCYILLIVFFVEIIVKMIHVPALYKKQYGVILSIMVVCVLGNGIFLIQSDIIDLSVLFYAFAVMAFYHFSTDYLPRRLGLDMGQLILTKSNSAFFFFDLDGTCIFSNELAQKWLSVKRRESNLEDLKGILPLDAEDQDQTQTVNLAVDGEERSFRESQQRFEDAKGRYLGCYFRLEDITDELREQQRRIYQSTHNGLTGIYNQDAFVREAKDMLANHPDQPYSIITTNIQQFKILNDLLGRERGDELLKTVGHTLRELAHEGVVFGRLGNDKFAVCAPTELHFEKGLSASLEGKFTELRSSYNLSLSILNYYGVYGVTDRSLSITAMCDRANIALKSVMGDIDRRIGYYDTRMRDTLLLENRLLAELPAALQGNQFVLYYQPQIDSRTNRIVGAEALVRWQHPDDGLIQPGIFIPLFERTGYIYELDQYVWASACRDQRRLRDAGYHVPVSVNISPRDVYSVDIYQVINGLIDRHGIPPESLNLEITESALVLDIDKLDAIVRQLRERGFRIEMDDFGSGYSSLNTLKDMHVDVLKLDMRFLENAKESDRSAKIITMIADLSRSLQTPLIAEGVEEKDQVDFLLGIGCHNLQGYYYSRPIPYDDFCSMLTRYEVGALE